MQHCVNLKWISEWLWSSEVIAVTIFIFKHTHSLGGRRFSTFSFYLNTFKHKPPPLPPHFVTRAIHCDMLM